MKILIIVCCTLSGVVLLATGVNASTSNADVGRDSHPYPRTFMIHSNKSPDALTKFDWIVTYPQFDIRRFRRVNPSGIAMIYVHREPHGVPLVWPWHESAVNATYQETSNDRYPGVMERWSDEGWKGGYDSTIDGAAANVGYMRPWDIRWDTLHNADGAFAVFDSCQAGTTCHEWNIARPLTAQLNAQLMVYAAKRSHLYRHGWDGLWSDNVTCATMGASWALPNQDSNRDGLSDDPATIRHLTCNGLDWIMTYLRNSLPGKYVGGNGAGSAWNSAAISGFGWQGDDPAAYLKFANATMSETFDAYQGNADAFISWNRGWLNYPDPKGMPRMHAFWDAYVPMTLQRMRWGLTLSMMASSYYKAPDGRWHDEYWGGKLNKRGYLGQATGPPRKLPNGVWRRDFDNGIALNNSTAAPATVELETSTRGRVRRAPRRLPQQPGSRSAQSASPCQFRKLTGSEDPAVNNGAVVSRVTIAASDGLILLKECGRPARRRHAADNQAMRERPGARERPRAPCRRSAAAR